MYCVIDLRPHLDEAESLLSAVDKDAKLTRRQMAELCYHHLSDNMNHRMRWADTTSLAIDMLIRAGYAEDDAGCFMATVFEEYTNYVSDLMHQYLGDATWLMWSAIKKGEDITLISGEDYRIVEWEHMVETGKIPRPSNYPKPRVAKKPVPVVHEHPKAMEWAMARLSRGIWRYTMAPLRYSQPNKVRQTED